MFLHDTELTASGKAKPALGALTDGLLYTLWDLGMKVGHSVRSVLDCVHVANTNMQSKTSLIEARLIASIVPLNSPLSVCVRFRSHTNWASAKPYGESDQK